MSSDPDSSGLPLSGTSRQPPHVPDGHESVLLNEVIEILAPRQGGVIVDCTVGRAGHALAIAERLGAGGTLIALDMDERNLEFAANRLAAAPCNVRLFHANFAELPEVLGQAGLSAVDGILADLGVSTNQLFDARYGLSFSADMPLDMRLDSRLTRTASMLVNHLPETELADFLFQLAQERFSRRIARKITEARRVSPITSTAELAALVRSAVPRQGGGDRIDPATRTFLALRILVNRELENLEQFLRLAPAHLKPGGRLVVISFQSTEDRVVKHSFRSAGESGLVNVLTRKPVEPSESEVASNPRSRSAKLRAVERR